MAETIRIEESTPNGGDYSEILYLDGDGNVTEEESATHCVIRECLSDGTLIAETWGVI